MRETRLESAIIHPSYKAVRNIKRHEEMIKERQTNYRCCPGDVPRELREAAAKKKLRRDRVTSSKEKGGRGRAVLDPDLEIRGGGGGAVSQNIFSALWALVWSTNKGATRPPPPWAPPLDPPL